MKKLDTKTWERFSDAHATLTALKDEAEALIDSMNAALAEIAERANAAREAAYEALDEAANDAESYYDERSEKWQEGEAGQIYSDWKDELSTARDQLGDDISLDVEMPEGISTLEDMIGALDGGFRQTPED